MLKSPVEAALTTCETAIDVLAAKVAFPVYCAAMEWVPAARLVVANVATPAVIAPVPIWTEPSRKLTVPEMVPVLCEATFAVKVTDWPTVEGFGAEVNVVVDAELPVPLTICEAPEE